MHLTRAVAGAVVVFALALFAGCGSSGSAKSSDTSWKDPPDVCSAITEQQVADIIGPTTRIDSTKMSCGFGRRTGKTTPAAFFTVTASNPEDGWMDQQTAHLVAIVNGEPEVLEGVGDQAVVVVGAASLDSDTMGGGLVQKDGTLVMVTFLAGGELSEADVEVMTTKLIELAASKI